MSDMHGNAARVAESESGDERMNGANGMSDVKNVKRVTTLKGNGKT